jgi:hypothetical protein
MNRKSAVKSLRQVFKTELKHCDLETARLRVLEKEYQIQGRDKIRVEIFIKLIIRLRRLYAYCFKKLRENNLTSYAKHKPKLMEVRSRFIRRRPSIEKRLFKWRLKETKTTNPSTPGQEPTQDSDSTQDTINGEQQQPK